MNQNAAEYKILRLQVNYYYLEQLEKHGDTEYSRWRMNDDMVSSW